MRPLDEVLVAAREYHERDHSGEPDIRWLPLRRELEEWEAQIESNMKNVSMSAGHYLAVRAERDEIRRLLGRTEPEVEPKRKPRLYDLQRGDRKEISQAMARRLMEACEVAHEAIDIFLADQSYAKDPRCGLVQPVTVDDCHELGRAFNLLGSALAIARAEIGEEADRG
jgi:hypothetical protein